MSFRGAGVGLDISLYHHFPGPRQWIAVVSISPHIRLVIYDRVLGFLVELLDPHLVDEDTFKLRGWVKDNGVKKESL